MQPELYFYEQCLRERHVDIQPAARAARLRPQQHCAARDMDPNPVKRYRSGRTSGPHSSKLGATSYGGPAMMRIMQAELQQERQWVSKERFSALVLGQF